MTPSNSKEQILQTKMTDLGLGDLFNGWFKKNPDITLKEFISLNNDELKSTNAKCVSGIGWLEKKQFCFSKSSWSFRKLKHFLLDNDFDHNDWILLLPAINDPRTRDYDISVLSTDQIRKLPLYQICNLKPSCKTFIILARYFLPLPISSRTFNKKMFTTALTFTVEKLLSLDEDDIVLIIKRKRGSNSQLTARESNNFKIMLGKIQKKLRKLGFQKDEPLLGVTLSKISAKIKKE